MPVNKGCEMDSSASKTFIIKDEDFLKNHIEAKDYTPYLYIYGIFSEEEMESVDVISEFSKRNEYFLKLLSRKGKYAYTIFKKGLQKRGYLDLKLLHERLRTVSEISLGHIIIDRQWREAIDPNDEYMIISNYDYIVRNIEARRLTSYLASKNVIDGFDMSNIDSLPKSLGNKELLRVVCYRGPTSFMWFVEGLRVCGYGRVCAVLLGRPVTAGTLKMSTVEDSDSDDYCKEAGNQINYVKNSISKEEETNSNTGQPKIISKNDADTSTNVQINKGKENAISLWILNSQEDKVAIDRLRDENNSRDGKKSNSFADSSSSSSSSSTEDKKRKLKITVKMDEEKHSNTENTDIIDPSTSPKSLSSSSSWSSPFSETDENASMKRGEKTKKRRGEKKNKAHDNNNTEKGHIIMPAVDYKGNMKDRKRISEIDIDDNKMTMKTDTNHKSDTNSYSRSPFQKVTKRQILREPLEINLRNKLRKHETFLEVSIEANHVASHLFGHSIIDRCDLETIRSLTNEQQRVRELISLLSWGGSKVYDLFMKALEDCSYSEVRNILLLNSHVSETTQHHIPYESNLNDIFFSQMERNVPRIKVDEVSTGKESNVEVDTGNMKRLNRQTDHC